MELTLDNKTKHDIHIFFVDDEDFLVNMWRLTLERHGYQVTAHTDSLEALETFRKAPASYDIVITDQTMPKMNGLDFAAKLLGIRKDIPIVLCTGYSELVNEDLIRKMGIKELIMKPFDYHRLEKIINHLIPGK